MVNILKIPSKSIETTVNNFLTLNYYEIPPMEHLEKLKLNFKKLFKGQELNLLKDILKKFTFAAPNLKKLSIGISLFSVLAIEGDELDLKLKLKEYAEVIYNMVKVLNEVGLNVEYMEKFKNCQYSSIDIYWSPYQYVC